MGFVEFATQYDLNLTSSFIKSQNRDIGSLAGKNSDKWPDHKPMIMKAFLAISCLLATAFADEAYVKTHLPGHWKENQYQRNGLNNFLYEMGKGVIN